VFPTLPAGGLCLVEKIETPGEAPTQSCTNTRGPPSCGVTGVGVTVQGNSVGCAGHVVFWVVKRGYCSIVVVRDAKKPAGLSKSDLL